MRTHPRSRPCPPERIAPLVAFALALAPLHTPRAAPPDQAGPSDDDLARAKQLFDAGVARYTAADYEAAVDLWLEAYSLVPPSIDNRLILAELIYNVARAQQKWFEIDRDIKHLRQAREIMVGYRAEVDELYPADQVAMERERIDDQIAGLEAQIGEAEAEQARREAELAERMRPTFDEEADAREERRNKAMIGAGVGLTTLGIGGVGLLVAGLVITNNANATVAGLPLEADVQAREAAIDRGEAGNALIVTGILAGGVLLAAGVPLLGVGLASERKRKIRRANAGLDQAAHLDGVAPLWLPGGGGLGLSGKF
jgi:tetratricopeptide (TPR) repeat protein